MLRSCAGGDSNSSLGINTMGIAYVGVVNQPYFFPSAWESDPTKHDDSVLAA